MGEPETTKKLTLEDWLGRDLSAAAQADELLPAFEMEPLLEQVRAALAAGMHPLLLGDPGVGKTAVVHELLRQHVAGHKVPRLDGFRVVQVSLNKLLLSVTDNEPLSGLLEPLLSAALEMRPALALHFTDFHEVSGAWAAFERFVLRSPAPILAEGERKQCEAAFEDVPELADSFVPIYVDEPDPPTLERIVSAWAGEQARRGGRSYTPTACEHALSLAQRFLTRKRMPRSVLDLLTQTAVLRPAGEVVDHQAIIERFCSTQRVRRELVDPALPLDLDELARSLERAVLGQPEAVRAIVTMIGAIKAGLCDERRSLGVFLFVGPTGVGKTHLAQSLASYLFGSRDRLIRLNMADFPGGAEPLFGNTWGDRGLLTRRLAGCPFGVVLLDEFEKASESVRDRFLQLFDEGAFINGPGEIVVCRSMIFIATSNAGAEVFRGQPFGFPSGQESGLSEKFQRALECLFRFELLNRFDAVVHFYPLTRHDIRAIGLREIELLKVRAGLRQGKLELEVDESVLDWLAANGYDPEFGARFLRRTVERTVTSALSEVLVRQRPVPGSTVTLYVGANRIRARALEPQRRSGGRPKVALAAGPGETRRVLDEAGLREEAEHILRSRAALQHRLEEERQEYSALVERMNEPGFWSDAAQQQAVLRRFRELDVGIRMQERLAEPLQRLAELLAAGSGAPELEVLGECVEQAAASLQEWESRLDDEGPGAAWLVLSDTDALRAANEWIAQLVEMELAWCRERLHLAAGVVAYEAADGRLRRVVLELEGPGAFARLEPECGLHRFHRSEAHDLRVRIERFARGSPAAGVWPRLAPAPRRAPRYFGLTPRCSARLELPRRGTTLELLAENEDLLNHFLDDVRASWNAVPTEPDEVARHYNEDGCGARDPRTGASVVHLKDVLRGGLEPFLEGWRRNRRVAAQR